MKTIITNINSITNTTCVVNMITNVNSRIGSICDVF